MFEERKIHVAGLAGILLAPSNAQKAPVALLLHGFGNRKAEAGDIYKTLASALAAGGIASRRFDFRGWGKVAARWPIRQSRKKWRMPIRPLAI